MSDILIKNMEIPKDYKYVDVRIFCDGTATTASAEEPFYKKMDVVEVPTPHGDLIDRDKASERFAELSENEAKLGFEYCSASYTLASLFLQNKSEFPTIIDEVDT